jgi:hypothetical protein
MADVVYGLAAVLSLGLLVLVLGMVVVGAGGIASGEAFFGSCPTCGRMRILHADEDRVGPCHRCAPEAHAHRHFHRSRPAH